MTQPTPAQTRICPNCDGFPTVAIDTGTRHRNGARKTLRITCPACRGTGHTTALLTRRAQAAV
ncbi:hypothetical protein OHA45_16530 [Streptomyces lydicus]|uniref:hypothetical protein n=1 Tax=Streptomyces lydicus TaxID=47763 RepID=UPI002E336814|nr:hypothetical protein [Streptomyces lydicus]